MRRDRNLREHRAKQLAQRKVLSIAERRRLAQQKALRKRKSKVIIDNRQKAVKNQSEDETVILLPGSPGAKEVHHQRLSRTRSGRSRLAKKLATQAPRDLASLPSTQPSDLQFVKFDKFTPTKTVRVCHLIESLGLGGAQTMMMELVNGLNTYFGDYVHSDVVCVNNKKQKGSEKLYGSYGVTPDSVIYENLSSYLSSREIDVVLHHRIAISKCVKNFLPKDTKYILLNHTWHAMRKLPQFVDCDYYVSVCKFLERHAIWPEFIHPSRRLVILNGVENNYLENISTAKLGKGFHTGRCHRMVASKFRLDSLTWMHTKVTKDIPTFKHHTIGAHKQAKLSAKKYNWLTYHGSILDRDKKMSILKALDVYYYETYQDEGASIAILEALSCGVPVITKSLGGCGELVTSGINGYIAKDRPQFLIRLVQLAQEDNLQSMKKSTLEDFDERLHVRHAACKYAQLFGELCK